MATQYRLINGVKTPITDGADAVPASTSPNPIGSNTPNPVKPLTSPTGIKAPSTGNTSTNVLKTPTITTSSVLPSTPKFSGDLGTQINKSGLNQGLENMNSYSKGIANLYTDNLKQKTEQSNYLINKQNEIVNEQAANLKESADIQKQSQDIGLEANIRNAQSSRDEGIRLTEKTIADTVLVNKENERKMNALMARTGGLGQLLPTEQMTLLANQGQQTLNDLTLKKNSYNTNYEATVKELYANYNNKLSEIHNVMNSSITKLRQDSFDKVGAIISKYGDDSLITIKSLEDLGKNIFDQYNKTISSGITLLQEENNKLQQAKEMQYKYDNLAFEKLQNTQQNELEKQKLALDTKQTNASIQNNADQISIQKQEAANRKLQIDTELQTQKALANPANIKTYGDAILNGDANFSIAQVDPSIRPQVLQYIKDNQLSQETKDNIQLAISGIPTQLRNSNIEKIAYEKSAKSKLAQGYTPFQAGLFAAGYALDRKNTPIEGVTLGDNLIMSMKSLGDGFMPKDEGFLSTISENIKDGKYSEAVRNYEGKTDAYILNMNKVEGKATPTKLGMANAIEQANTIKSLMNDYEKKYGSVGSLPATITNSWLNKMGYTSEQGKALTAINSKINAYSAQAINNLYGGSVTGMEADKANSMFASGDESFENVRAKLDAGLTTKSSELQNLRQMKGLPLLKMNDNGVLDLGELKEPSLLVKKYL